MGYTVKATTDMVAIGVSAIGNVQGAFVQNTKKLPEYYDAVAAGRFPIERGYELEPRRRDSAACDHRVDVQLPPRRGGGRAAIWHRLRRILRATSSRCSPPRTDSPVADGLVSVQRDRIDVQPVGRMFVRNVCMVFDKYLAARTGGPKPVFSRTV